TRVGRQDPRAELLALPGVLVDAPIVDPRRADRHGARTDSHPPLAGAAIAHNQPPTVRVALISEPLDVVGDLGLQRGRDHPPRTLAREIIERDHDLVVVLPNREPANICHGVPSFSAHGRSVFSNREGTPPTPSSPSTTSGYSSDRRGQSRR